MLNFRSKQVIQRLIERVSPERLEFVKSFRGNVYDLSTHPYGCRVLQRCFEHLPEEYTRPLLDEVHKCAIHLMQDQFGVRSDQNNVLRLLTRILGPELCYSIRIRTRPASGSSSDRVKAAWTNV